MALGVTLANPAHTAATEVKAALQKIELPKVDDLKPQELGAAAAQFAETLLKIEAALREIAKIQAEKLARDARIELLTALLAEADKPPIDMWCAYRTENLAVGSEVRTMEVPGWWLDEPVMRTSILFKDTNRKRAVSWLERSVNIAPGGVGWPQHGELHYGEGLTDAAMIWNLAMEPGHLKWRPLWRYGILTDLNSEANTGSVTLHPQMARKEQDDAGEMSINAKESLSGVPIVYPPCNARVFEKGDEVLVLFVNQDRATPAIIGFRREPRKCPPAWRQLQ